MNYDLELEKAILGIMIIDASIIPNITREIQESDFFDNFHREVFRVILTLNAKGGADLVSLNTETGGKNPGFIAALPDIMASSSNWQYYTRKIKKLSMVRGLGVLLENARMTLPDAVERDLSELIRCLTELSDVSGGNNIKSARELIVPMIEKVELAVKTRGAMVGLDTGFSGLNEKLDGFQSEYIIIGARPSIGKTSLAVNMMVKMAQKGIKTGFVSIEMQNIKIMMRLLSDVTNINSRSLRNGYLSGNNINQVCSSGERIAEYPFYIDDASQDLESVVSSCRSMVRILGIQVIFIDHAGMITVKDDIPGWDKASKISKTIKSVQKELNIPIILLSQVGRQTENKPPCLADLRGSGSFEEDADTVMFLHRERTESINDEPMDAELNISKARDGEIGIVPLLFFPKLTRFVDRIENKR